MIDYKFTCDGCDAVVEINDLDLSLAAPLPPGWRRITLTFPADDQGNETSEWAEQWEDEAKHELCPDCVKKVRKIFRDPDIESMTPEQRQELARKIEEGDA